MRCRGGKSNAYFAKTLDDRFVIKQLRKTEKSSFMEFAKHYFAYVAHCCRTGQATCLSKIFGLFHVRVGPNRSAANGSAHMTSDFSIDIVVMENVFYEVPVARMYDLKGTNNPNASHAYKPPESSGSNSVLTDEHLRQTMTMRPITLNPRERHRLLQVRHFLRWPLPLLTPCSANIAEHVQHVWHLHVSMYGARTYVFGANVANRWQRQSGCWRNRPCNVA